MVNRVLFPSEAYRQVQEIPGTGRYWLRAVIREEDEGAFILASEETIGHEPTEADIERVNRAAAEDHRELTIAEDTDRIKTLKQELSDGDYKVTKNGEWRNAQEALSGVTPALTDEGWPYPPVALHEEREAIRVEIRRLEQEIEDLTPVIDGAGANDMTAE